MRLASYVPGELIPLPLSGSIPELPHVEKVSLFDYLKILMALHDDDETGSAPASIPATSTRIRQHDDTGKRQRRGH